jgi:RHS repeat-associated protein
MKKIFPPFKPLLCQLLHSDADPCGGLEKPSAARAQAMATNATDDFMNSITTAARIAVLSAIALMFATPLCPRLLALDDHNPVGVTGAFEGVITTGGAYNVLNHNATRQIDDIVVPGSIGKYPLKMTRYYNSRRGFGDGWSHEYAWSSYNGKISYPNGTVWDNSCAGNWGLSGPLGVSDWRTTWNGYPAFRLADGGTIVFGSAQWTSVATKIIDPYGQETNITLGPNGRITRIAEPGGRYLQFTYNGSFLLTQVDAYDGRNNRIDYAVYHYTAIRPAGGGTSGTAVNCLTSVDYSDGTHAYYTYQDDNAPDHPGPPCPCSSKVYPLLRTCQDVRYKGPMRHICYEYQVSGPHGAIIAERYSLNGSTNGPRVSRIDPPAPSPIVNDPNFETTYTETRGDGNVTRTFNYTSLHIRRSDGEVCPTWFANLDPAPQQFLLNYTDFHGHTTYLGYDTNWYVNSVRDANNHTTTYIRGSPPPASIGEVLTITHPDDTHINYTYSDHGHYLMTIADERGEQSIHTRDAKRRITRTDYKDANNNLLAYETFTYCDQADAQCNNAFGQLKRHGMKNGAYVHYRYDSRGLLVDKWQPTWNAAALDTDPKTHYDYYTGVDGNPGWIDRVKKMTLPANFPNNLQASETYEYDRALGAGGLTDPNGAAVAGRGLMTKMTHGDSTYQQFGYDAYGNKRQEWNELSQLTRYTYDDYNRVLLIIDPLGETTQYDYAPTQGNSTQSQQRTSNSPYWVTTPSQIVTKNIYDENFRKTQSTVANGTSSAAATWFHYDNVGNQDWVTDPRGTTGRSYPNGDPAYTIYSDYDSRDRKWRTREPLSHTTWLEYGDNINVTKIHRPDGTVEEKVYDGMNRLSSDTVPKSTNPAVNIVTQFHYYPYNGDANGHSASLLSQVIDGNNHYYTFEYDSAGSKTKMTYPGNVSYQSWGYDGAHNLTSRTTLNGETQLFSYNIRNRKYANWWLNWDDTVRHPDWCYFGYDNAGRLIEAENGTGGWNTNIISDVHRSYDAAGHLSLDQQIVTGLGTKNVNYPTYDDDGRLTRMYVGGVSDYDYTFSYDAMGRFEKIFITNGGQLFQYYYDAASNEVQRDNRVNGVTQLYPRDELSRMQYMDVRSNGSPISHEDYNYNLMNRLTSVDRGTNQVDSFIYYLDGELKQAQYQYNSRTVTYTLDEAGNRTSVNDNVNGPVTYAPNAVNQYTSVSGSSIHNGPEQEVQTLNGVTYTYINDERLTQVSDGTNTYDLSYDALGRCVQRTLNGVASYYVYDGEKPILEYNATSGRVGYNLYGKGVDEILKRGANGADNQWHWYFFEQDHEGSILHLTDSSGTIIERYRYDAFGAPTIYGRYYDYRASTIYDNRFLFTGREYASTYRGIYNVPAFTFYEYRARAYNPQLGRFMSEDPKLFDAGDYNLFRYCHNDPIDFTDPMGLDTMANAMAVAEAVVPGQYEYNQMVVNFHAGNYGTAAGWAGTMLVSQYAGIVSGTSSTRAQASFRAARAAVAEGKAVSRTGYRYVGAKEARTISREGTIPLVDQRNRPKTVFYTDEKFTTGKAAKTGLDLDSKPTHRVEFSMDHAPAGSGRLTDHERVEFTLREGAEPIRANKLTLLNDAAPELEQDMASRHVPPKLDR